MIIDGMKALFKKVITDRDSVPPQFSSKQIIENTFDNSEISVTDIVELQFKDPREIGILQPNSTSHTRFNEGEFENSANRTIKGIVTKLWKENGSINEWMIEVLFVKKPINESYVSPVKERKLLLLSSELEWIRKL